MGALTVRGGLRPLVRTLREGRLVASLADQDGGPDGIFLPFLGRVASVQAGLFRLAARLGTPLVIGFCWWEDGRWRGRLDPPVFPGAAAGPSAVEAEARRLAARYTARVEEEVRRRPDHWFWVHRRWRTRPPEGRDAVQPSRPGRR
jgi:KDO2-lipid IV(A) lauroyltransferase